MSCRVCYSTRPHLEREEVFCLPLVHGRGAYLTRYLELICVMVVKLMLASRIAGSHGRVYFLCMDRWPSQPLDDEA